MYKVDLNSDLGESFGAYTIGSGVLCQCGLRFPCR